MADPASEKIQAYRAATELLGRKDYAVLRYVALELRRCIEAVVYEKLLAYGEGIPTEAARTWQPPQAFKALLAMEPDADKTATIAVAPQTERGVTSSGPLTKIGVDFRPNADWLQKTWQKLGSFLHADWPYAKSKVKENPREFYEKTLADLDPFVATSFTMTFAKWVDFDCSACGAPVKVSERNLTAMGAATCLKCFTRYTVVHSEGQFTFHLDQPASVWQCLACQEKIFLPFHDLEIGYRFSCGKCGCGFAIKDQRWLAERIDPDAETLE